MNYIPDDRLRISDNVKELVLKALNRFRLLKDASAVLGITRNKLLIYRREFNLVKIDGQWKEMVSKKEKTK